MTAPSPVSDQTLIIQALAHIPRGKVSTYGDIAKLAGLPGKSRYVGYTLKNLPNGSTIPWHRVINAKGEISFPEGSEKYQEQAKKLAEEEISLINGKIALKRYRWQP